MRSREIFGRPVNLPVDMRRAYALISNGNGRVLLVRNGSGKWTLPGGKAKKGESLRAAVKREVKEETGLKVKVLDPGPHRHVRAHGDRCKKCVLFGAEIRRGKPKPRAEITEVAWVKASKAPQKLGRFRSRRMRRALTSLL
jgi:8-oxo-dGTP diphosphatase